MRNAIDYTSRLRIVEARDSTSRLLIVEAPDSDWNMTTDPMISVDRWIEGRWVVGWSET